MKLTAGIIGIDFRGDGSMKSGMKLKKSITIIVGMSFLLGSVIIWRVREKKINQEIDEFDRNMREWKMRKVEQYDYYRKEACERKEVTKCCQIR